MNDDFKLASFCRSILVQFLLRDGSKHQDARSYNPDSHRLQLKKCREQHLITRQGIVLIQAGSLDKSYRSFSFVNGDYIRVTWKHHNDIVHLLERRDH
ncbi:hypothetical protein YC2023_008358 [Brassica napus]